MAVTAHCTVRWTALSRDSPALDDLLAPEDRERVERLRRPADRARARLAAAERAELARHGGQASWFLQRWTLKEAVVKATADGVRVPMCDVVVRDGRVVDYPGGAVAAAVTLDAPAGHIAALAALADGLQPVVDHGPGI